MEGKGMKCPRFVNWKGLEKEKQNFFDFKCVVDILGSSEYFSLFIAKDHRTQKANLKKKEKKIA